MDGEPGAVSLYVRKSQEYDVLSCVHSARKGIRYQGNLPKIPEAVKAAHYKLIRFAHDACGPDGDALSAFKTPSMPQGLVLRLVPAPGSAAYNRRMSRLPHLIMTVQNAEEERLMQLFRRRGCAVSQSRIKPKPKPVWWRPPEEEVLVPIAIPDVEDLREAIADLIGEFNTQHNLQEKAEELAPYMLDTVLPIAAAVTIQAAWRAFSARKHTDPPISTRLLHRRAAIALQRWWSNVLLKMRFRQLDTISRQMSMLKRFQSAHLVMTVGSYRRMTDLCAARAAGVGFPKVTPEHRMRFTFDKVNGVVAISSMDAVRRSIPKWCGVEVPTWFEEDATESYDAAHLKFLLFKGVGMEEVGPSQGDAGKYLATDYMMRLTYASPEEAQRRLALFAALSYDFLTSTQLVTLLPAPVSLDRRNPASIPGMGLTDAYSRLGSLEDMVQDVIPRDSPLWPYILQVLAPEVAEDHKPGTMLPLPAVPKTRLLRAPLPPPSSPMATRSTASHTQPATPADQPLESALDIASSPRPERGVSAVHERQLGPLRSASRNPSAIGIPSPWACSTPATFPDGQQWRPSSSRLLHEGNDPHDGQAIPGGIEDYMHGLVPPTAGSLYRNVLAMSSAAERTTSSQTGPPFSANDSAAIAQADPPEASNKGSLAASMALTRRLMGDLQRVESADAAVEIKINLRAELARRQEAVDAVKVSKGSGIKKYWRTTTPFSVNTVPNLKESTQAVVFANEAYVAEARELVTRMREEHREIQQLNETAKKKMLRGVAQVALHQQTSLLKEVDRRRTAEEEKNQKKVAARALIRQRAQILKRDRKFAQAFQRQHNLLNRQIVTAELHYRDVVEDDRKYSHMLMKREEEDARRKNFLTEVEATREAKREETLRWHVKCRDAIAKNKQDKLAVREVVEKRRAENRAARAAVGPAGGVWGARPPETYRTLLPLTAVSSTLERERSSYTVDTPADSSARRGTASSAAVASTLGAPSDVPSHASAVMRRERMEEEWVAELQGVDMDDSLLFIEDDTGGISPLHGFD